MTGYDLTKEWLQKHHLSAALGPLEHYANLVTEASTSQNLTAWSGDKFWTHGIYASLVAMHQVYGEGKGLKLVDIGSGAGVPALPYLIVFPHVKAVLLEPRRKRYEFLKATCLALNLSYTEVKMLKAEQLKSAEFNAVSAQAVAPLNELIMLSWHLGSKGAKFLFFKGLSLAEEIKAAKITIDHFKISYEIAPLNLPWSPDQTLLTFTKA